MAAQTDNIYKLDAKVITGLEHNPKVWISEGSSRFCTNWKNRQITWAELLKRLENATMTQETQSEYMRMAKTDQDKIKDVGGFVGGTLKSGRRKTDTVQSRSLITFDLDFAPTDFVETMQLEAPYAWAIYSTHKHKPDSPRYRLIAPLDRDVDPEEYEAIMRKMAEHIGLKYFDPTTVQASRLMYWPSYSRDAEYVFEYNDDKILSADKILAEYPDWRDMSYWPLFPDEIKVQKRRQDKQQDPLKKKGLVGTFCRTYTVPEAIAEFLPDVYTPVEGKEDRYTYTAGTTSGGLVIYDEGLFCYSNHSTDPAHGMDLNAFDLVRIHKFGQMDEDAPEGTQTTRLPSYKEMIDFIRQDKNCIRTFDADRKASAVSDFEGDEDAPAVHEWKLDLTRNKQGLVETTIENLLMILRKDEGLKGIKFNKLSGFIEITTPVPWKKELTEWKDADDSALYIYLATEYNTFKRTDIYDALSQVSADRSFHPVRDYLKSLPEWDGVPRMETLFIDYLGAEDEDYTREVTKRWMIAAISRAKRPGVKFDYIPVLSGPGGIGKSTLVAKLGGPWFSDSLSFEDMKDKTAAEKIQGTWINEISELKGMRKMDIESVKSFVSRTEDRYRAAYGRRTDTHRRGCVFIGTSNADDYLKDITGNRRFWPIDCSEDHKLKAWDLTPDAVAQIWAEALFYYEELDDRSLVLNEDLDKIATSKQIRALEQDERLGLVSEYLEKLLPEDWDDKDLTERRFFMDDSASVGTVKRTEVSVMEIWAECFKMSPAAKKRADSDDIARILLQLGWKRSGNAKRIKIYGLQRCYQAPKKPVTKKG